MSLYLWVILGTIAGPLALSFDKKVHFYTYWKSIFAATLMVAVFFLIWDEYFTVHQVWGFTPRYLQGIYLGHLPLEECLFFLVVPYACLFIHEVLKAYFATVKTETLGKIFAFAFVFSGLVFAFIFRARWYTMTACSLSSLLIIGLFFQLKVKWFGQFAFTYMVAVIPFLIVNGILTGFCTEEPIVWYSADHIMGPRIATIPVEDLYYNLCMLLPIIGLHEWLQAKWSKKKQPQN